MSSCMQFCSTWLLEVSGASTRRMNQNDVHVTYMDSTQSFLPQPNLDLYRTVRCMEVYFSLSLRTSSRRRGGFGRGEGVLTWVDSRQMA